MEEPNQNTAPPRDWESSGAASTSSSSVQVREGEEEEEERDERPPLLLQPRTGVSYNGHFPTADNDDDLLRSIRDDTWSWVVVVLTFWFFVSMTLILGVYGSVTLRLGPYCSLLIQSNHLFVKYVKVEELNQSKTSPSFYGFYQTPIPDVNTTWSENLDVCLPADFHKDWVYNLNEGSQINISYSVNSRSSSSLILIIAEGNDGFARWLENPSYPNTTLSWNIIRGSGLIQQDILTTSSYYVAVVNLNSEEMEVQLSLRVKAILYNTSDSYYTCNLAHGSCSLKLLFPFTNAALITTPGPEQDIATDEWYVKLSYEPRWITYLLGIGGMTVVIILVFHFLNYCRCTDTEANRVQFGEMRPERTLLLSQKDDDLSSWGSSYESVSQDDEDPEDPEDSWAGVLLEGKPVKGGEYNNNTRRLCAICFDAPRDCFFLPCGHCVSCFACGTRIAELVGTCPICRRNMKKVRRIFTV